MAEIVSWVSDQLHDVVGLSDKHVAEFFVELAKKSRNPQEFISKLLNTGTVSSSESVEKFAKELWSKVPHKRIEEKPSRIYEREAIRQQAKYSSYKLLLDTELEDRPVKTSKRKKEKERIKSKKVQRKNIRSRKASWESDEEDIATNDPSNEPNSDSDEFEKLEQERKEDLAERDALSERLRLKDKEKTRHVMERSDKKAYEEAKKRLKLAEEDKKKLIPELRKVSRRTYLDKRRAEKVIELRDDIADEEFLFSETKLTKVEKEEFDYKRKVFALAKEHEQVAQLEKVQRYYIPTEDSKPQKYEEPHEKSEFGPNADVKKWQDGKLE